MPDTDPWTGIRVPLGNEADVVPADLARMREDFRDLLNLKAVNEADRNARYGDVPSGTLVSSTTTRDVWKKLDTGWKLVSGGDGWNPLAASWNPLWEDAGCEYSLDSRMTNVGFRCLYNGPDVVATQYGHLADITVCTLPLALRPHHAETGTWVGNYTSGAVSIYSSGAVVICDAYPLTGLVTDGTFTWSASYMRG